MHRQGDDRYLCANGRIRVVLYDGRPESPTYETVAQFHFGDEAPGFSGSRPVCGTRTRTTGTPTP